MTVTVGSTRSHRPHGRCHGFGEFREYAAPVPDVILEQRRVINQRAHEAAALRRRRVEAEGVPTIDTEQPYTTVYTDGSSTGGWGAGGWAWCVIDGPRAGEHDSGGESWTTNQRMELQAAHMAVRGLPGLLLVVSDSAYVVNCFADEWWRGWLARDYRKVKNDDIWRPFVADVLDRRGEVRFTWVKGHTGLDGNEEADRLAKAAKLAAAEQDSS